MAELSRGKLGYIHIPSMDEAGLDRFVRALYSDNFDKDGIVLDVRYNGGGFTHDQVLNYLGGKEHTIFRQRDGGEGLVLRTLRPQVDEAARAAHQQPLLSATPRSSRTPSARWAWASWSASRPAASSSARRAIASSTARRSACRGRASTSRRREHGEGGRRPRRRASSPPRGTQSRRGPAARQGGRGAAKDVDAWKKKQKDEIAARTTEQKPEVAKEGDAGKPSGMAPGGSK